MQIKIFTFPFQPGIGGFATESLDRFCLDKEIFDLEGHFFLREGQPYWTVWVRFRSIPAEIPNEENASMGERERLLLNRLKDWRNEEAEKQGIPHFLICKNRELKSIAETQPTTLKQLADIHGFGPKKVGRFGQAILDLVTAFQAPSTETFKE